MFGRSDKKMTNVFQYVQEVAGRELIHCFATYDRKIYNGDVDSIYTCYKYATRIWMMTSDEGRLH